jgi:heterodisulfide reductase subunit A-like polyferredoxin
LIELEGAPGAFGAKIRQKPRFVDTLKCTSCSECTKVCPITVPNEYDEGLSDRKAIYKQYAQAIPGAFAINKLGTAPCKATCPAHVSVQGFIALMNQGKYKEALKLFKTSHPFPGVCGRVCHHPCEGECTRKDVDDPLAIAHLHRFLADWDLKNETDYIPEKKDEKDEKVAIIGSGPAGLTCAYFLAICGYKVTIFEKLPILGGMLTVGIPSYRLPRNIIEAEIKVIEALGVKFRTGVEIGKDITIQGLRKDGFKAFFVGIGSHKSRKLGIQGEDTQGVYPGIDFLREVNLGNTVSLGDRVAVVGGGNVAMDSVRTALRTGSSKPFVIYRRTREEMPANHEEIEECREEGIDIMTLTNPVRVISEAGKVKAIECIRMELGEPDESGRKRPVPIKGSEFTIEVDAVIPAIGQDSDWTCLSEESKYTLNKWGTINVDEVTYQSDAPDIFAGGDATTGPATVVEAIAAGQKAAISIDRFIRGEEPAEAGEKKDWTGVTDIPTQGVEILCKEKMNALLPEKRIGNFKEVQLGFDQEQCRKEAERCLKCGVCCECYECVEACLANAIDHEQKGVERTIDIGSLVLCPGTRPFDPSDMELLYHYKSNPNVMTSLEFERLLSASGPTMGHLLCPSDNKEPKKIAWLQCVGSRDTNKCGNGYCSSVCCMYAIKDAMIAKEHAKGELDCTIFNMDVRTFGKDYEKYYKRAKDKDGVRFVKARVHTIDEVGENKELHIRYADEAGRINEEKFDIVVLSVGLEVTESTKELAARLDLEVDKYNFAVTDPFTPVQTSRDGVYACGVFESPKDIPSSITQASAAACMAGQSIGTARNTLTKTLEVPKEIDVMNQEPRVGVFICNCGINIAGIVDVQKVEEYAKTLPNVVFATQNLFTCSQDSQERMKEIIKEEGLNRIVVAACTPKTHEAIFMDTLEACGLNKYLFEMANIRNQDSWVHSELSEKASEKANNLIRMAVARAVTLNPLHEKRISVIPKALVIGGGVAGMNAALGIAEQGFEVILVEKEPKLGGMANRLSKTIQGADITGYVNELTEKVNAHPKVQVLTRSLIVGFSGFKGNFTTEVLVGPGMYERKIEHGVVILATGATEYKPDQYLYGKDDRVMTQVELTDRLNNKGADDLQQVVMIQCVGSRNDDNPNCSRICCQAAIKNALHIKEGNTETQVFVLYRDIRMYGLLEDYYKEAREKGVMFFRYEHDDPPKVESVEGDLMVTFKDHVLGKYLRVSADILGLSAGMIAEDTEELASIVKLARTAEGHFMEAHVKLRPVDMATDAIFLCGTAHSPQLISESISQAQAAASRATTFLSRTELTLSAVTAKVRGEDCAACLICVRSCPYSVPRINEDGESEIDVALCHGCGVCAAECPAKAIELNWYEDDQILSKVEALLEGVI